MPNDDPFQADAGRVPEIVCGAVLLVFAVPIGLSSVLVPAWGKWQIGAILGALLLALIAWGLGLLGVRLLLGRARTGKNLLPPIALYVAAGMFVASGVGMLYLAISDKQPKGFINSLGSFAIAYYAWRHAQKRRATL